MFIWIAKNPSDSEDVQTMFSQPDTEGAYFYGDYGDDESYVVWEKYVLVKVEEDNG